MDDLPAEEPEEAAGWIMTFADLMSLLMCFFVLLLSFSEMDLQKYKQVAGSMEKAFGVQKIVKAQESPMGTSFVALEFSPGKPDPTPFEEILQKTAPTVDTSLAVGETASDSNNTDIATTDVDEFAAKVAENLVEDIKAGKLKLETKEKKIIIRILENSSFPSGSAIIREDFFPVLDKISRSLIGVPGIITVVGHTDNVPISTDLFGSNWELSTSRAVSVIHELVLNTELNPDKMYVVGYGETRPIAPNDTPENRAKNRRVEIVIEPGRVEEPEIQDVISVGTEEDADSIDIESEPEVDPETGLPLYPIDDSITEDQVYNPETGEFDTVEGADVLETPLEEVEIGDALDPEELVLEPVDDIELENNETLLEEPEINIEIGEEITDAGAAAFESVEDAPVSDEPGEEIQDLLNEL